MHKQGEEVIELSTMDIRVGGKEGGEQEQDPGPDIKISGGDNNEQKKSKSNMFSIFKKEKNNLSGKNKCKRRPNRRIIKKGKRKI